MTALPEYQRLEAQGLWRETPEAQRQQVILSFGDATLVISDDRAVKALAHWSLPAMIRLNPGKRPALYAPSDEPGEELELDDDTMIAAIEKVHALIEARRPHPGRLRTALFGGLGVLAALLILFWLPGALIDQAARVAPLPKRTEIGRAVLAELTTLTGAPCRSPAGNSALRALARRLNGANEIVVLPGTLRGARLLPGRIAVIGADAIEGPDTPEVAAGQLIALHLASAGRDPLQDLLDWAGPLAALRLLTTGNLSPEYLKGYGRELLETPPARPADEPLLQAFAEAGVSATPYAFALDPSGESVLGLIEADPFKGAPAPEPVLADGQWVALRDICSD
ncbi:hypothetical protein [Pseudothioclava arenosa]|uniref:Uncharacterized protein n=1 Tax=Pseudothioclava arenosa TaxID=1795308 RepID=A0A2A4CPT6_9RHOB|nr:hypothetical protein [Pseudothioclava arenosa]PCD76126.1 hypothetical protein CLN94_09830 [Pseudothioclava arenosa]